MAKTRFMLGVAGALALSWVAVCPAAEVRTRVYGECAPASTDGRVVTRTVTEEVPPSVGTTPFALSIGPGVSLPFDDWSVVGLRLNLFAGRHRDVWGIDAGGLGNEVTGHLTGVQGAGIWNHVGQADAAIQLAGIANLCERDFNGLQSAGIYNWAGGTMTGLQVALVNRAGGFAGLQLGLFNAVDNGGGVQIGLFNTARALAGVQIGLVNVNENSTVPFLPVINMAF